MFELHPQLRQDCLDLGCFPLARLLLMNDKRFPWFILVPARAEVREIFQLDWNDQVQLLRESSHLASRIAEVFQPDKLNIAAIGNLVPQLHVHHIARCRADPLWPAPVWGSGPAIPYDAAEVARLCAALCPRLEEGFMMKVSGTA